MTLIVGLPLLPFWVFTSLVTYTLYTLPRGLLFAVGLFFVLVVYLVVVGYELTDLMLVLGDFSALTPLDFLICFDFARMGTFVLVPDFVAT